MRAGVESGAGASIIDCCAQPRISHIGHEAPCYDEAADTKMIRKK